MKLLEYKAKELFDKYGLPTMPGIVVNSKENVAEKIAQGGLSYPVVLKAQVQIGGRGKAGGIQFADNGEEAQAITDKLLFSQLRGFDVNNLLIVEKADLDTEWYLSIMLDRATKAPLIIFSAMGGIDIEETAKTDPDKILKVAVNPILGIQDYTVRYLVTKSGVGEQFFDGLKNILTRLYKIGRAHV